MYIMKLVNLFQSLVELRRLGREGLNQYTWHKSEPRLIKDETREFRSLWGWSRPGDRSRTGSGQMNDSSEGTRAKIILALSGFRDLSFFFKKIFRPSELTSTVPSTFSHSLYYALPILQTLLLPSFTSKLTSPLILTILVQSFKHYSFYPSNLTPPILQSLLVLSLKPFYFYPLNLTPPIIPSLKPYYFYLLHLWNFSAPILYPFILITP